LLLQQLLRPPRQRLRWQQWRRRLPRLQRRLWVLL
jgi:hypothetical protein